MRFITLVLLAIVSNFALAQPFAADSAFIVNNYVKWERMVPMRDGTRLFTSIYVPKDSSVKHPILMTRTPYSSGPYGEGKFRSIWNTNHGLYAMKKYIIVFQDVRGRFMSEGTFEDVRPFNPSKKGSEYDEASDTYDAIEWLINNVPGNNRNVGVFGISYPGFYSTMAALNGHPALKAVSPQAPVTDWFMGDDFHHNGAFMLIDAFEFYTGFGVPRPLPVTRYNRGFDRSEKDAYQFYLRTGALPNFNRQYLGDSIAFWNTLMSQPVYNDWWQQRNTRNHVANIKPAMLVVGGTFDAEDCFGAWNLYKAIEEKNGTSQHNKVVMGPWFHGAWGGRSTGEKLGDVKFGSTTSFWYQQNIEVPFFEHYLNNGQAASISEATVFFTGENGWKQFDEWPSKKMALTPIYFQPRGKLSFAKPKSLKAAQKPIEANSFTMYVSDPANPVPHEGSDTILERTREYMINDQRFASKRKDVITFKTDVLKDALTLAGPVYADLMVSIGSTDADFVVKIIDEFPDNVSAAVTGSDTVYRGDSKMNGFQMLVRGEVMRGKFRNSFESPEPFVPNKITQVKFYLPDVAHTFQKGHRLIIQVQSSWFPLVDRNPQVFTDIFKAQDSDFQKTEVRLFHADGITSKILLPVLKK
jgi:putative CocE/NonD family hydrolase